MIDLAGEAGVVKWENCIMYCKIDPLLEKSVFCLYIGASKWWGFKHSNIKNISCLYLFPKGTFSCTGGGPWRAPLRTYSEAKLG